MKRAIILSLSRRAAFLAIFGLGLAVLAAPEKNGEKPEIKPGFHDITAEKAHRLLRPPQPRPKMVILDIRTAREFKQGHLKGAKNIDFFSRDFAQRIAELDRARPYLVHCASGGRSRRSLKIFRSLKFKCVYHMKDGYKAWAKGGYPVAK